MPYVIYSKRQHVASRKGTVLMVSESVFYLCIMLSQCQKNLGRTALFVPLTFASTVFVIYCGQLTLFISPCEVL